MPLLAIGGWTPTPGHAHDDVDDVDDDVDDVDVDDYADDDADDVDDDNVNDDVDDGEGGGEDMLAEKSNNPNLKGCLLYTSPSPRDS